MRLSWWVISAVLISSCNKEEPGRCFKSLGEVITEERSTEGFNKIEIDDRIHLFITQDTIEQVIITGGSNLLPHIVTTTTDSVLRISDNNTCAWLRKYDSQVSVQVSVRNLREISYSSAGNLTFTNYLVGDTFRLEQWDGSGTVNLKLDVGTCFLNQHTGTADIFAVGTVEMGFMYTTTNSPMDCSKLICERVFASNLGIADVKVHAGNKLTGFIHHTGNIFYKGNPTEVNKNLLGEGVIEPI